MLQGDRVDLDERSIPSGASLRFLTAQKRYTYTYVSNDKYKINLMSYKNIYTYKII